MNGQDDLDSESFVHDFLKDTHGLKADPQKSERVELLSHANAE